jgi:hypothetical protein
LDKVFNRLVASATRLGLSVWGSRILRVQGRKSGKWHSTPVNVLTLNGDRYLVAPRGETQWVRNLRVAGRGELVLGHEGLDPGESVPVLRAYLRRWRFEVGRFFGGVSADAPDEEMRRIATEHPVFRITTAPAP